MLKDSFNLENKITLKSVLKIVPAVALVVIISGSILVKSGRKVETERQDILELNGIEKSTKDTLHLMADIDSLIDNDINRGGLSSDPEKKNTDIKLKQIKLSDKYIADIEAASLIDEDVTKIDDKDSENIVESEAKAVGDFSSLEIQNGTVSSSSAATVRTNDNIQTANGLASKPTTEVTTQTTTATTQAPTTTTTEAPTTTTQTPTTQATQAPANNYYGPDNLNLSGYIGSVAQPGSGYYGAGWCTWYAYNARYAIGRPLPTNLGAADSWPYRATAAGYVVNNTPAVGAVIYMGNMHVAFVEAVYEDGSILISEGGWNFTAFGYNKRILPASTTGYYSYIH